MKSVPVVALAGFLGAGKTTIINNLLADSQGMRIGVLLNDFGAVNVDSKLVSGQIGEPVELANGCICCMMDGNALDEPLAKLMRLKPDAILIEASGLAEPRELAMKILGSKVPRVEYGGIVYVVDCLNFAEVFERFAPQIQVGLRVADMVILNKYDGGGLPAELKFEGLGVKTADGRVAPEVVFGMKLSEKPHGHHHHNHIHTHFSSASFATDKPLGPKEFIDFVNGLQKEVYRAKGVMYFGMKGLEQKYIFQKVGSFKTIDRAEWKSGEKPMTSLTVIGTDFDEVGMERKMRRLIDKTPGDVTAENTIKL